MSLQLPPRHNLNTQNTQDEQPRSANALHLQGPNANGPQSGAAFPHRAMPRPEIHSPQGFPSQPRPMQPGYPPQQQGIAQPGRPPQPRPMRPGYPPQQQGIAQPGRPPQPRPMQPGYPPQQQGAAQPTRPPQPRPMQPGYPPQQQGAAQPGRPPQPRPMQPGYPPQQQGAAQPSRPPQPRPMPTERPMVPPVQEPAAPPQPSGQAAPSASEAPRTPKAPPLVPLGPRKIANVFTEEQLELFDKEKFSELHFDIQNSLKRFPNNIDAHYGLGLCSMAVGEPERAAVHLGKALDLDDSIRPGEMIQEIPTSDPEDWLLMAEELGHSGFLDAAVDICTRILGSDRFAPKIRALASKTKETVEQDFYAARERIVSGNAPKDKGDSTATYKAASVISLVVIPLIIIMIAGCWTYSSFQFSAGQSQLRIGIYRYERMRVGDKTQDKNGPVENYFYNANKYFEKAYRTNPFSFETLYYQEKNYAVLYKLGEFRNRDIYNLDQYSWKPGRFKEVNSSREEIVAKIKEKNVSVERMNKEKKLWQEFYQMAKKDPGTAVF